MSNLQALSDRTAIGLSLLCTVHCLVFPLLIVLLPSFASLPLNDESFHFWMLVAVLPTSIYALTLGCRKHKHYQLVALGAFGLLILVVAYLLGEESIGEYGEKALTVLGAAFIALGHFRNYRLCHHQDNCDCSDPESHRGL